MEVGREKEMEGTQTAILLTLKSSNSEDGGVTNMEDKHGRFSGRGRESKRKQEFCVYLL